MKEKRAKGGGRREEGKGGPGKMPEQRGDGEGSYYGS